MKRLSFAQRQALEAAHHGEDTSWVHGNTINSLLRRGFIRWMEGSEGHYITTPAGEAYVGMPAGKWGW